ncbi:hypothetical protein RRG08_062149 [Elysia crispata]|uniref:Uncharacterized protein n=1 Tax=Elysia crispata TaxID=231223 RepID=A0AAE0YN08_9GAST|nr:hypothetical protein RRG08_062149 [Elysia crispata]
MRETSGPCVTKLSQNPVVCTLHERFMSDGLTPVDREDFITVYLSVCDPGRPPPLLPDGLTLPGLPRCRQPRSEVARQSLTKCSPLSTQGE